MWQAAAALAACTVLSLAPSAGFAKPRREKAPPEQWVMSLEGGRRLTWERSFQSETEVKTSRGFWNKLVDFVAGEPEFHYMVRPYSVATDSRGRIIVTDPGAAWRAHLRFHRSTNTNSSSARKRAKIRCSRRSASPSMRRTIST